MRGVSYNFQFLSTVLVSLLARLSTTTKYNDKDIFCYSEPGLAVVVVCLF